MRYCFGVDGTICGRVADSDYRTAVPIERAVDAVNRLHDDGHVIILLAALDSSSGIDWSDFTRRQLDSWGLKYHELITDGKPSYDVFVDDKAISATDWRRQCGATKGIVAGAFDVMHPGYCRMFQFSREHCAHLTVALHRDPSVERPKLKPVLSVDERTEVLRSLRWVDDVVVYDTEADLARLLRSGNFHMRFLGDDYIGKAVTAQDAPLTVVWVPRDHGYSTTQYKKAIAESLAGWKPRV